MYRNGQLVNIFLGEDRRLYIDRLSGKPLCQFEGRIFYRTGDDNDIISITKIPQNYDGGKVIPPSCFEVQGLGND